jgi:hypothetical protein
MVDEFEKKWQLCQIQGWQDDKSSIVNFFDRFDIDIADLYSHITSIDYDRMQVICYLLSKIDLAVKLCDHLDNLKKKDYADVDIVKIYLLISHAEITINNFGIQGNKVDLVKKFFDPVAEKHGLKHKLRAGLEGIEKTGYIPYYKILYKIRCQYTHEGDYTGKIFKNTNDDKKTVLIIQFIDNEKFIEGESNLTYDEFINIYMDALVANIKFYSNYKDNSTK